MNNSPGKNFLLKYISKKLIKTIKDCDFTSSLFRKVYDRERAV